MIVLIFVIFLFINSIGGNNILETTNKNKINYA